MKPNTKLVILPGWEQHRIHWQPILDKLSGDVDVEVIEFPGFGKEPLISTDWGVPEYAEWLMEKVDESVILSQAKDLSNDSIQSVKNSSVKPQNDNVTKASLFQEEEERYSKTIFLGHSFGGRIAHYLAAKYQPEWLAGLILYGAPVLYRPNIKTKSQIVLVKFIKRFIPIKTIPKSLRQKFYSDDLSQSQTTGKEEIIRKVIGFDQTELLAQNKYPTVLLWGQQDQSVSLSLAQEMHSKLAKSELIVLTGEGHNIHLDNPNLFYGTLKQILQNNF